MDKEYSNNSMLNSVIRCTELYELSSELANVVYTILDVTVDYCHEKGIPIMKDTGMCNLLEESRHIFKQIEKISSPNYHAPNPSQIESIRRKFTGEKSDEESPEPY